MQLRQKSAFTVTEVMVVVAILILLTSLSVPIVVSARESGKQRSCASNLRQIYIGAQIYASDNPGYDQVHPDVDWPQGIPENLYSLRSFVSADVFYCPETPVCVDRKSVMSTYVFSGLPRKVREAQPGWAEQLDGEMAATKNMTPVVFCLGHDEAYYYPRESHIDMMLNPPFVIDLTANGAIRSGRRKVARQFIFKRSCTRSAIGGS